MHLRSPAAEHVDLEEGGRGPRARRSYRGDKERRVNCRVLVQTNATKLFLLFLVMCLLWRMERAAVEAKAAKRDASLRKRIEEAAAADALAAASARLPEALPDDATAAAAAAGAAAASRGRPDAKVATTMAREAASPGHVAVKSTGKAAAIAALAKAKERAAAQTGDMAARLERSLARIDEVRAELRRPGLNQLRKRHLLKELAALNDAKKTALSKGFRTHRVGRARRQAPKRRGALVAPAAAAAALTGSLADAGWRLAGTPAAAGGGAVAEARPWVRGVATRHLGRFLARAAEGEFECLGGGQVVALARLNDDYCDCDDGSDEPGTAACAGREKPTMAGAHHGMFRFHCAAESHGDDAGVPAHTRFAPRASVQLSRVNDGVCDCCDGSDEWRRAEAQACPDTCRGAAEAARRQREVWERGHARRQSLVKKAQGMRSALDGGPDGVFVALSQSCFTLVDGKYRYEVCPYKHVKQDAVLLGKSPRLEVTMQKEEDEEEEEEGPDSGAHHRVRMHFSNGAACPNGIRRSAVVDFVCGEESALLRVTEPSTCVYNFECSTPAACD